MLQNEEENSSVKKKKKCLGSIKYKVSFHKITFASDLLDIIPFTGICDALSQEQTTVKQNILLVYAQVITNPSINVLCLINQMQK